MCWKCVRSPEWRYGDWVMKYASLEASGWTRVKQGSFVPKCQDVVKVRFPLFPTFTLCEKIHLKFLFTWHMSTKLLPDLQTLRYFRMCSKVCRICHRCPCLRNKCICFHGKRWDEVHDTLHSHICKLNIRLEQGAWMLLRPCGEGEVEGVRNSIMRWHI